MRARAGWYAALLYLFCVLAPGVALALGDAASCLTAEKTATIVVDTNDQALPMNLEDSSHLHHVVQAGHHAEAVTGTHEQGRHHHGGKASHGPCCAILCLSAIATDPPTFARPLLSISASVSENFQRLPGKAPPLLYRPPIA